MTTPEGVPIEQPAEEPELFRDSFGIKELQTMLDQEKLDVEEVLRIVEEELEASAPDPEDLEAAEEYKLKMYLLNELAQREVGRTAVLRERQEKIDERVRQLTTSD